MRLLVGCALLAFACSTAAGGAPAAEIPEPIHQAYLQGPQTVVWATDPARIPLTGTDWLGHYRSPYVSVFVNGRGPFTFLVDTGSSVTTLSTKVVKAASVQIVSAVPGHHAIARADEIRAGGVSMRDYYAVVEDGDDVDGILGFNAFGKAYLTFDFSNSTLIASGNLVPLTGAFWLPYTLIKHLPNINLSADGQTLPTLIDTGDDAYSWETTSAGVKALAFTHPPALAATVVNGDTGVTQTTITTLDGDLSLGPLLSQRPALAINESLPVPDIGMPVIDQFDVEFDRIAQRVAFAPRFAGTRFAVPGFLTPGFSVSFGEPGRVVVRYVVPNLQPAKLGIQRGDVIGTIDGRPATEMSYRSWDALVRSRRPISMTWNSSGVVKSATFPVVELR